MDDLLVRRLVELNAEFYDTFARPFSASRSAPQPGFSQLLEHFPRGLLNVLDVGCGNGRFGRFLRSVGKLESYTGIDASSALLAEVTDLDGELLVRDISRPDCLTGLGVFDVVACLATLQHIPGQSNRLRLLQKMASHLIPNGLLVLSNWQFLSNSRQRRKILPWSSVGIDPTQLEPNDYLLSWERGGRGHRYVSYIDADSMAAMADIAKLRVVTQFFSDGREGSLNLYTILAG